MLLKKMLRDIWSNKGSYIACLVIVIIGLIVFTSFSILSDNLDLSKNTFYTEQNFADGFVELKSMPMANVDSLKDIDGIKNINGRVVKEVRVNDEDKDEAVYLDLVFFEMESEHRINDVKVLQGSDLDGDFGDGSLNTALDNQFFEVNNLNLADQVEVIAGGRIRELNIKSVGMSPEFTYPLRSESDMFPNPEQYGIAFLSYDDVSQVFPDMTNRINSLVFTLKEDANYDLVEESLEEELRQYGLKSVYPRAEQTSHLMLSEEVEMLGRVSTAMPLMFLGIASIIIYIMLKRLVEQQRGQIGILKAFGYTNSEVMIHYISYALFVGVVGGFLGGILGIIYSIPLTALLMEFFNVPEVYERFSLYYLFLGIILSTGVFALAGFQGCKHVLKLKPAEAMRPPAPVFTGKALLEKINFFWNLLTIQGKMAVRNLSRNKSRSLFMFIGITLSCSVVALTWSLNDMVDKLTLRQFEEVETYDARINLANPVNRETAMRELENIDEISRIEPMSEIPATLSNKWHSEDVLILGLINNPTLYNIMDWEDRRVIPEEREVILSERLADKLDVNVGSTIELESPFIRGGRPQDGIFETKEITVTKIIPQYLGMNAYMNINFMDKILNQGSIATTFLINVSSDNLDSISTGNTREDKSIISLRDKYRESDVVTGIDSRWERIRQTKELLETFGSVIYLYVMIGVVICFAIIYSSSFIILSERSRELASMRVLGMTSNEVFSVITFEQWFVSIFGIIAGIPLAKFMQWALSDELSTDYYIIPSDISMTSLFVAVMLTIISVWIAQRFALKKVENLSLVEVLKSRE